MSNSKEEKKNVTLTSKQVNKINRYIIDMTKHLPEKTMASLKWQKDSSVVLRSLGIH